MFTIHPVNILSVSLAYKLSNASHAHNCYTIATHGQIDVKGWVVQLTSSKAWLNVKMKNVRIRTVMPSCLGTLRYSSIPRWNNVII